MSKERAQRRAERELLAAQRENEHRQAVAKARRRARLTGRGLRSGNASRGRTRVVDARTRERRAVIGSTLLVIVVLTWVISRSAVLTVGVLIAAAVATPAVVTLLSDKRR